jgi:ribose transport system ATP-binding protein
MTQTLLRVENIGKRIGSTVAPRGASFSVEKAEIVAFIGGHGSGASTLMKTLSGIYKADTGPIYVDEKPIKITRPQDALASGIVFIHREPKLFDNLDIGSNVYLGREPNILGFINTSEMYRRSQVHLNRVGLEVDARTPLSQLSIAEQQLVAIARALSQNAKVIVMDQLTASLGFEEVEHLLAICKKLRSEGISILYIAHHLSEIVEIADRVVDLREPALA